MPCLSDKTPLKSNGLSSFVFDAMFVSGNEDAGVWSVFWDDMVYVFVREEFMVAGVALEVFGGWHGVLSS